MKPDLATNGGFDASTITRPDAKLLRYYAVISLLTGPLFPFMFLPLACKFATLKYKFDDDGVSMSWGVLFRREVVLTYRRIQDIHLTRNIVQRWLGLATVAVQTASGSAAAEMSIEGILQAEQLRDHLYREMRGARGEKEPRGETAEATQATDVAPDDEALLVLRDIRDALATLAARFETGSSG